jgi:hypothetical protein
MNFETGMFLHIVLQTLLEGPCVNRECLTWIWRVGDKQELILAKKKKEFCPCFHPLFLILLDHSRLFQSRNLTC